MGEEQFRDKTIICQDCGTQFMHSAAEQEFFRERGFMNEPKRCKECRRKRKSQRGDPSRSRAPYAREAPPRRSSRPPPAPRVQPVAVPVAPAEETDGGEMKVAICGRCGRETQLAHRPSPLRPVFCKECYEEWRAESGGGQTT